MSEGVCDMSTGIMYYESTHYGRATARRAPGGLPGAAVRAGRLLELWGYRAARHEERSVQLDIRGVAGVEHRVAGASSTMTTPPRIY
jgi:hypothetical protein